MQEGFEKNIQQRMQDFNLEPSPMVWTEIDASLNDKKRRRFAAWWWLLPPAAAMLAAFIILTYKTTKNSNSSLSENAESISSNNKILLPVPEIEFMIETIFSSLTVLLLISNT